MQDLIGRTLGHYRIVDEIGEGGICLLYTSDAADDLYSV